MKLALVLVVCKLILLLFFSIFSLSPLLQKFQNKLLLYYSQKIIRKDDTLSIAFKRPQPLCNDVKIELYHREKFTKVKKIEKLKIIIKLLLFFNL